MSLAWSCVLLSIVIFTCLYTLFTRPGLGAFLLLLLTVLLLNHCTPAPRKSICGVTFKFILVVFAAVFATFSGSTENDAGSQTYIVAPTNASSSSAAAASSWRPPLMSYGICGAQIASLRPTDYCVLSCLAYSDDEAAGRDTSLWFAPAMNLTTVQRATLDSGLHFDVYFANASQVGKDTYYVAVRGSRAERDFSQDLSLWQEAIMLRPYNVFPIPAQKAIIAVFAQITSLFTDGTDTAYVTDLVNSVQSLQAANPNASIVLTGHSLGGGLSSMVGDFLSLPSISFSGPGTILTSSKFQWRWMSAGYQSRIVVMPDYDLVPRVDYQAGTVQNIRCGTDSPLTCHNCVRTCCELLSSCKDPYARSLNCPV